jgi:hypothetical protein
MATTTNFGWETPDDTDLVKDGAAAIRTLGQAIDTSMADLEGGTTGQVLSKASNADMDFTWVTSDDANAIQNAIVDAKGDLIAATAADTPARLAVGTNGQVLTADSAEATGLKWATASSGGLTLLATTTLSGSATTVSSISGSYKNLLFVIKNIRQSDDDSGAYLNLNGDSGANYQYINYRMLGSTLSGQSNNDSTIIDNFFNISTNGTSPANLGAATINLYRYTDTDVVNGDWRFSGAKNDGSPAGAQGQFSYNCSAAITSLTLTTYTGTFTSGTIYTYGVN